MHSAEQQGAKFFCLLTHSLAVQRQRLRKLCCQKDQKNVKKSPNKSRANRLYGVVISVELLLLYYYQGRSQDTLGATEAERRRRENRSAKGAERGGDWGGVSPSPTDYGD